MLFRLEFEAVRIKLILGSIEKTEKAVVDRFRGAIYYFY